MKCSPVSSRSSSQASFQHPLPRPCPFIHAGWGQLLCVLPQLSAGSYFDDVAQELVQVENALDQELNTVIISFEGPTFFAPEDEEQFFGWLGSLPEYKDIRGKGTTLDLELAHPISADTVRQLLVLFRRWCVDPDPLRPLWSPETAGFVLWETSLREASIAVGLQIEA
ncbi:hypothetical protein QSH18_01745 [Xanthomonas sp. NCPPB 2654]|uniref:hypothetical protein n=1 Tax=unclassified Xanthomonas TaxID=2643310 RepID=UPI0021E0946D|nr:MULTISPECIES: hypothetical protein [unclassified Xanthomonas]MDL5364321.1 hypothetical protein [Xanthomonas sp. NCPPB 2654]UYC20384.1 hypothetical protein NUG20_19910 [Xanthomonas sp. CFBP 8443]